MEEKRDSLAGGRSNGYVKASRLGDMAYQSIPGLPSLGKFPVDGFGGITITQQDVDKHPEVQGLHPGYYQMIHDVPVPWTQQADGSFASPAIHVSTDRPVTDDIISDVNSWLGGYDEHTGRSGRFGRFDFAAFAADQRRKRQPDSLTQQAAKGGDPDRFKMSRNVLATDKVPKTIFGFTVVSERGDYTPGDLEFFRENPEAGGYYDLGDEGGDVVRGDVLGGDSRPDEVKRHYRDPVTGKDNVPDGRYFRQDAKGGKAEEFMKRNPSLFSHVKAFEKMREGPYDDVGGYAIGYGAHLDKDGNPVTKDTAAINEATATAMLARDLYARREKLAKLLPNWSSIPGNARQALLDVSMGKDNILSASESKGLHGDLTAAGKDAAKLLAAVKKHYYSYLTEDPKYREGLMARRVAGGKLFFGEDFSYDGKTWNPKLGFVKKGGK